MSLATLAEMRRERVRPTAVVKLVAGPMPDWLASRPDVIAVTESPERMDWRPVVGLPFAVFVADGFLDLGERAFECAIAAGGNPLGVAFSDSAHSLTEEAMAPLRRMWEALCKC